MTSRFGLPIQKLQAIQKVFANYPEIERVVLYGSRAKGNYHAGSDIDLALFTPSDTPFSLLTHVSFALDDLDMPWGCDVALVGLIENEQLLDHIQRVGIEIYNAEQAKLTAQMNQAFSRKVEREEAHRES